jgi:hypothetical protein
VLLLVTLEHIAENGGATELLLLHLLRVALLFTEVGRFTLQLLGSLAFNVLALALGTLGLHLLGLVAVGNVGDAAALVEADRLGHVELPVLLLVNGVHGLAFAFDCDLKENNEFLLNIFFLFYPF